MTTPRPFPFLDALLAVVLLGSNAACSTAGAARPEPAPVASSPASSPASAPTATSPACSLPAADRAWLDRAVEAWRFTSRELTGIESMPRFRAYIFSADCLLTSDDALADVDGPATWNAAPHDGTFSVPDGEEVPVGITSYASGHDGLTYFVMSTPTVWRAGGLGDKEVDLETTMVAVLLHEASHVAQIGPYGKRLGDLIERYSLPDSFNDDAVQERFAEDEAFAASVRRETDLLLAAAASPDDAEVRRLAGEARQLMRTRQKRWFVGADAYLLEAEDLWLTFEGAGQWAGFRWLTDPRGAGLPKAQVMPRFGHGRRWSQTEGLALALALDRLAPAWRQHAFGDGAKTFLQMLDDALVG